MRNKQKENLLDGFNNRKGGFSGGSSKIEISNLETLSGLDYVSHSELKINKENPFELLKGQDKERLVLDIKENGVLVPLIVREKDNVVLDGNNRLTIAKELNLKKIPVQYVEKSISKNEEKKLILRLQVNRRNLDHDKMVSHLVELYPEYFNNTNLRGGDKRSKKIKKTGVPLVGKISKETGLNPKTIQRAKKKHLEITGKKQAKQKNNSTVTTKDQQLLIKELKSSMKPLQAFWEGLSKDNQTSLMLKLKDQISKLLK